jgi:hypothetical protein
MATKLHQISQNFIKFRTNFTTLVVYLALCHLVKHWFALDHQKATLSVVSIQMGDCSKNNFLPISKKTQSDLMQKIECLITSRCCNLGFPSQNDRHLLLPYNTVTSPV